MKKLLLILLFLFAVSFSASWIIQGNGVYWSENGYTISVYPATSNALINHVQYVNFTSTNPATIYTNLSFVFPQQPLSGNVYLWQNISHTVQVPVIIRQNSSYTINNVINYTPSNASCEIGDSENALKYLVNYNNGTAYSTVACFNSYTNISNNYTLFYTANATSYQPQTQYWYDWNSILGSFTYTQVGNKSVYTINNVMFNGTTNYATKFEYSMPRGSSGKFDIYAHAGSPSDVVNGIAPVYVALDPWWNGTWQYSSCYQATTSMINGTQYNYTTLFNTTNSAFTKGSFNSLRFVSYDNSTELPYEIVNFNSSIGFIEAYMMFPILDPSSTNTSAFCLYYGNTAVASTQNSNNTWDNYYILVMHNNETSGTIYDSTSPMNNGTASNLAYQGITNESLINGANTFKWSSASKITTPNIAALNPSYITVEAIVKMNSYNASGMGIVNKWWDGATRGYALMSGNTGGANFAWDVGIGGTDRLVLVYAPAGTSYTPHYVSATLNGTHQAIYLDLTNSNITALAGTVPTNTACLTIGAEPRNNACNLFINYITASIDEVRISNIARNSSYHNTTYNNMLNNTNFWTKINDYTANTAFTLINQTPADITSTNLFVQRLNLTYNITGANASSVYLSYKTNNSDDCSYFTQGIQTCGWQNISGTNIGSLNATWEWLLSDNQIYPATYNWNQSDMATAAKQNITLQLTSLARTNLTNVSSTKQYGFFEIYAQNNSGTSGDLMFYYCNSSYNTGSVLLSSNCYNFYNLPANSTYNHTHSANSSHYLIPFPVVSGSIGGVGITANSQFIVRSNTMSGWTVFYLANDTATASSSINDGVTWSSITGTIDAHLHQFSGTDVFRYQACDSSGCNGIYNDTLDLTLLPPSSPTLITPANAASYRAENETVNISWHASVSPQNSSIVRYNISLLNSDNSFNRTINDTTNGTSLIWNASGLFPVGSHVFSLYILAVDNNSLTSEYFMIGNFTILTNSAPVISNLTLMPTNPTNATDLNCSFLATDANLDVMNSTVNWYLNNTFQPALLSTQSGITNGSIVSFTLGKANLTAGDYWNCSVSLTDFLNTTAAFSTNVTVIGALENSSCLVLNNYHNLTQYTAVQPALTPSSTDIYITGQVEIRNNCTGNYYGFFNLSQKDTLVDCPSTTNCTHNITIANALATNATVNVTMAFKTNITATDNGDTGIFPYFAYKTNLEYLFAKAFNHTISNVYVNLTYPTAAGTNNVDAFVCNQNTCSAAVATDWNGIAYTHTGNDILLVSSFDNLGFIISYNIYVAGSGSGGGSSSVGYHTQELEQAVEQFIAAAPLIEPDTLTTIVNKLKDGSLLPLCCGVPLLLGIIYLAWGRNRR